MKLNTKMRYGTRAMLELASRYGQGPVPLSDVALSQELSAKYLEALMSSLRLAGLVRAQHGSQGGYELTRPPAEINLRQIYEVLEGTEPYVPCTDDPSTCGRQATCVTRQIWEQMYAASMQVLEDTTLADLVAQSVPDCASVPNYQI
ncbi:MAG: RrF2 family transcriptional regulator [Anaerolineae bacterium]